jgi:hypothetical protein
LSARWFFLESFGIAGDVQAGSAYLAGGSLVFRPGARAPAVEKNP